METVRTNCSNLISDENSGTVVNNINSGSESNNSDDIASKIEKNNDENSNTSGSLLLDRNNGERKEDEKQLCIAPTNNQFRLRIIPIERLLEKPPVPLTASKPELKLRLPERKKRNNTSIIELSDTSSKESDEEIIIKHQTKRQIKKIEKPSAEVEKPYTKVIKSICAEKRNEEVTSSSIDLNSKIVIEGDRQKLRKLCVRLKRIPLLQFSKQVNGSRMNTLTATHSKAATSSAKNRKSMVSSESDNSDCEGSNDVSSQAKQDAISSDYSDVKSSDSEIIPSRKKRTFNKTKNSTDSDSDFKPKEKQPRKRSRIIKKSSDDSDQSGEEDEKNKNKRKHIRKIISTKDLDISTKTATKEEEERRKRIEERQKIYNKIYDKAESVEVTELVLDFDEESKDPLLEVDKGILKKLKPHQVAGVKFMWDACFETLKDTNEKCGSGCILAHCMGLGKTLQVVTLSHTLLVNARKTQVERVLVISPLSTLNNWAREFKHWISFARKKEVEIYDMSKYKDKSTRIFKLNEWFEEGGACILGYDMFRILSNDKAKGLRKKQRETLQKVLVEPGPDLVICDEGHLLKNEKTSISKAVNRMRTKRRIVLTGTPLQNNLKEYYCMIQFIKPNLLGTYKEYLNRFVNPITNGQYTDSTDRDIRLMKHRSHILHKMLEGCIQRRDYSVLAPYLPPKHEYVVYTTLSILQELLYEHYMTVQRDKCSSDITGKGARLFQDFQDLRRIWTHPMNLRVNSDNVIRKRLMANDSDSMEDFICDDEDDEEENGSISEENSVDSSKSFGSGGGVSGTDIKRRKTRNNKDINEDSDMEDTTPIVEKEDDPSEWWKRFVADKELNNINHSPKLVILLHLLKQCEAIGDKVLVFSQSLQSLDVIEHFLSLINEKTKGQEIEGDVDDLTGIWTAGVDYFRLDGSCSVEQREAMCKKFNDVTNLRARLFLISTRAGGLGINLVAANRVVIFDVSWNPSHDTQSIFRVYRFGQEKPCYIYRLIAMGTMEQKVYERQVAKQATAKRVIDEQQISRHYNQSDLQELYTYELRPSTEREVPILPKDRLFAELLTEHESLLFKYHEHDSLLENEESENLSEAERKAAWSEYEAEKTRSVQTAQYISYDRGAFGSQFGNAAGSVTSNKIFGFRSDVLLQLLNMKIAKDLPDLNQNQILQLVPRYLQQLYGEMNVGNPSMYKDLLALHGTLAHPSGMYMNPLLYANQNPSAAGYYQAPAVQQQQPAAPVTQPPNHGFNPNEVYEID
ncbi:transcriptional regulator ATRX homolog [Teleopsis dalmanni]|uniref:transcriptional regulator ATRX homolog n=1 Tax=Teleopsis dalmanni TaxID=139649 RepID=UPI0018CE5C0C|nr:transcriptional regulator ATRX homolog [Teleopsis dalmanni]XP_037945218.1 transcriptional regulator ATRX homolog [Teleopsis dalmanni]XP_037945219.1 transcriptional regulator ATRX homolog [Teleopsis dalmanni]XP_037945220.1 transcriptional regulator ATRX homolog [Teleopsis dalmanni]XP_037945221.1 transcriptional regulator ATRX homolog [Teleopsis dalmanni]XP_037945222.1 transcriptional regulator ATRX homolog [Teleopsis dalmanni]XP_037945223.1 transcriptional regulator ATRX homolog [Teleopsis 